MKRKIKKKVFIIVGGGEGLGESAFRTFSCIQSISIRPLRMFLLCVLCYLSCCMQR